MGPIVPGNRKERGSGPLMSAGAVGECEAWKEGAEAGLPSVCRRQCLGRGSVGPGSQISPGALCLRLQHGPELFL